MNKSKPKVLYFCSSGVFGGAEKFVETCLAEDIHNSDIFFLNSGDFVDRCRVAGFRIFISPYKVRLTNIFSWIKFQFYFFRFLKQSDHQIIHFTMPYSIIFGSLAAKIAGKKIVWFQHGPIGGIIDRLANLMPFDFIFFNSKFSQQEHINKVGRLKVSSTILNPLIKVNYNSIEVEKIREEFASADGLLICAGRICRWKGFEHAIRALSLIDNKPNLVIVGKPSTSDDSKYFDELKEIVSDLKLNNQVQFLGFKENVYDYIKASDLLIHTSTDPEPYGIIIAESIALGVHVIVNKLGGVGEIVDKYPQLSSSYEHTEGDSQIVMAINNYYLNKTETVAHVKIPQVSEMTHELNCVYMTLL